MSIDYFIKEFDEAVNDMLEISELTIEQYIRNIPYWERKLKDLQNLNKELEAYNTNGVQ